MARMFSENVGKPEKKLLKQFQKIIIFEKKTLH